MSRAPLAFKETDITRAIKAARKAGLGVARVEIDKEGKIVIVAEKTGETPASGNPWDGVLIDGQN
jgi:hypothetical protein